MIKMKPVCEICNKIVDPKEAAQHERACNFILSGTLEEAIAEVTKRKTELDGAKNFKLLEDVLERLIKELDDESCNSDHPPNFQSFLYHLSVLAKAARS